MLYRVGWLEEVVAWLSGYGMILRVLAPRCVDLGSWGDDNTGARLGKPVEGEEVKGRGSSQSSSKPPVSISCTQKAISGL